MFNPFKLWRNYKRNTELENDARDGIYFFRIRDRFLTKVDPMIAYVKLKEHGFDVFGEDYEGVVKANPLKSKLFLKAICEVFDLTEYDPKTNTGITLMEAMRLYLSFFYYLLSLKKNVYVLREYLPSLEDRLNALYANTVGNSESIVNFSTSDSTSTSSTEPEPPVSESSTEPQESSTGQ